MAQNRTETVFNFAIPAQDIARALASFSRVTNLQVIADTAMLAGQRSTAVSGRMTAQAALAQLTSGSRVSAQIMGATVVVKLAPIARPAERGHNVPPSRASGPAQQATGQEIIVTGSTTEGGTASVGRQIDLVAYDDVATGANVGTIAAGLISLPGVSAVEDADEPQYIVVRGIASDLNQTTIDGVTLATVGTSGEGSRRANLQLLPSYISKHTSLTKTFTADIDAGSIGSAINVETRSAFDPKRRQYALIDLYGIYSTIGTQGDRIGDEKPRFGKGIKAIYSQRFGTEDQFGIMLSGMYQQRVRNSIKAWQVNRNYYDANNRLISGPLEELGYTGNASPGSYRYATYDNVLSTYGGSVKLEWRPSSMPLEASLLLYSYSRGEDSTMIQNDIAMSSGGYSATETGGRARISNITSRYRHDTWDRNSRGAIGTATWRGERSELVLRGGHTRERYSNDQPYIYARATFSNQFVRFDNGSFAYPVLETPDLIQKGAYKLAPQFSQIDEYAREWVNDFRADYSFNAGSDALGAGFKLGGNVRRLDIFKDNEVLYSVSGLDMSNYLISSDYKHPQSNYLFYRIDQDKFFNEALPGLGINQTGSLHNSRASDYSYVEDLKAVYAAATYANARLRGEVGVRFEDVGFRARSPIMTEGVLQDGLGTNRGGYSYFLPSLSLQYQIASGTKLLFAASKTLGRPRPADIAAAENSTCGGDEDNGFCSITKGNPNLKPRQSKNLDVQLSQRLQGGNIWLSLGYFKKWIKDDIFTLRSIEERDGDLVNIRQPTNAESSWIQGVEAAASIRSLPGLSNLGVSANGTWLNGAMRIANEKTTRKLDRLLEQPKWLGNVKLNWSLPKLRANVRASLNYRGSYMSSIGASPWLDEGKSSLTTLDLSFDKEVFPGVIVKADFANILDQQPRYTLGMQQEFIRQIDDYGRTFYLHLIIRPFQAR